MTRSPEGDGQELTWEYALQRAFEHLEHVENESYRTVVGRFQYVQMHAQMSQAWMTVARELTQRERADL